MNQEDILKMAREAGLIDEVLGSHLSRTAYPILERFAALVAAKAAQDEREACAKRCEEKSDYWIGQCDTTSSALQACAASLRARGK